MSRCPRPHSHAVHAIVKAKWKSDDARMRSQEFGMGRNVREFRSYKESPESEAREACTWMLFWCCFRSIDVGVRMSSQGSDGIRSLWPYRKSEMGGVGPSSQPTSLFCNVRLIPGFKSFSKQYRNDDVTRTRGRDRSERLGSRRHQILGGVWRSGRSGTCR